MNPPKETKMVTTFMGRPVEDLDESESRAALRYLLETTRNMETELRRLRDRLHSLEVRMPLDGARVREVVLDEVAGWYRGVNE